MLAALSHAEITVHVISTVTSLTDAVDFTGINHISLKLSLRKEREKLSLINTDIEKTFCSKRQHNTLNDLSNLT